MRKLRLPGLKLLPKLMHQSWACVQKRLQNHEVLMNAGLFFWSDLWRWAVQRSKIKIHPAEGKLPCWSHDWRVLASDLVSGALEHRFITNRVLFCVAYLGYFVLLFPACLASMAVTRKQRCPLRDSERWVGTWPERQRLMPTHLCVPTTGCMLKWLKCSVLIAGCLVLLKHQNTIWNDFPWPWRTFSPLFFPPLTY